MFVIVAIPWIAIPAADPPRFTRLTGEDRVESAPVRSFSRLSAWRQLVVS
jgi:hypothetical protein